MFYAYSTKGGHSENDKCRNLQLKNRHGIRFHTLVGFFSQQKCNYRLITGSVFFLNSNSQKARVQGRLLQNCFETSFILIRFVENGYVSPMYQHNISIESYFALHWNRWKGTLWTVSVFFIFCTRTTVNNRRRKLHVTWC